MKFYSVLIVEVATPMCACVCAYVRAWCVCVCVCVYVCECVSGHVSWKWSRVYQHQRIPLTTSKAYFVKVARCYFPLLHAALRESLVCASLRLHVYMCIRLRSSCPINWEAAKEWGLGLWMRT